MKKVILSVFVVGALLATSCKNTKEEAKDAATDAVEAVENATEEATDAATKAVEETKEAAGEAAEATEEAVESVKSAIEGIEIPQFEDPKVGEYLQTYSQYAKDYIEAKGDVVKNTELAKKGVELATQAKDIVANLDEAAAEKFNSVMTAIQSKMAPAQ
ncbi:hypothetical protein [Tenacibaculum sp. L6]|uniref:hypothetical protein n=1 Tax=Tenacibaculum sp. L6 TaxID=2992764 RepID=UPI00237C4895|nr:hypothetical protein [Tenacibaculum sp. L6]MDE0536021.1 hypothetical protein [Tenacibaculum sp. L6]